ncbi:hypothetical protein NU10_02500 [Flavobacterium dauae]|uniref:hypothetical protein n=1 Tax=Flavobacterium dauae TaxID=1563479 RepID=UPI00101B2DFC|nr:hypothetical protein [Flavobacterium dauae]WLD24291.1 hypothetical protein NU10_02500 [Flavobacterium dauae]
MNYATQNTIGNNQHSRKRQAKATAPTIGRVRRVDAKTQRRQRSTERQTAIRTDSDATNGILMCSFLPKLKTGENLQACQKTERDFYKSLSKIAKSYKVEPMQTKEYGYPYNVALALWDMQTKLKQTHRDWDRLYLAKSKRKAFLATTENFDTGTTLYYIPIVPLFLMLKDPKRKKNAQLLLSVCSYLYRVAGVPYYRDDGTFLGGQYEMHKEWMEQEETDECYQDELAVAEYTGDKMEQKLRNPNNVKLFEQRLSRFKSRDAFDNECWQVACNAFVLYSEYPTAGIFRNAPLNYYDPYADEYDNEVIGMEKYISFIADTKGWLYRNICESINNEFNEIGGLEEPTIYKPIDGSKIAGNNFDFEKRFFELLDKLCGLLYEYKTTGI